jgi:hypothetical protein
MEEAQKLLITSKQLKTQLNSSAIVFSAPNFLLQIATHKKNDSVSRVFSSLFTVLNHRKYRKIVKKRYSTMQCYEKRKAFAQCYLIYGYLGKQDQKFKKRTQRKAPTVTGLSGNCMQNEQLKLLSIIPRTSLLPSIVSFPFLQFASSSPSDGPAPLHISSCRLFAFSRSVNDRSDSIARIAAIRSPEPPDPPETTGSPSLGGGRRSETCEQSGHSHWRASARVSGREEMQLTCQGVAHVLHVRVSSGEGLFLHAMQIPSPSHGSSLTCAMVVYDKRRSRR